jgi:hypothetical protein
LDEKELKYKFESLVEIITNDKGIITKDVRVEIYQLLIDMLSKHAMDMLDLKNEEELELLIKLRNKES